MARFSSSVVAAAANVGGQSPRRGRFWHPGSYKICSSFFQKLAMRAINHQDMECEHGETNWWRVLWYLKTFCHDISTPKKNISYLFLFQFSQTGGFILVSGSKIMAPQTAGWFAAQHRHQRLTPRLCFLVSKAYELQLEISSVNPSPILVGGFKHEFLG